jgi:hypothetical protein
MEAGRRVQVSLETRRQGSAVMRRRTKWLLGLVSVLAVVGGVDSLVWTPKRSLAAGYEQIQTGMTREEVVSLLGPATRSKGDCEMRKEYWQTWYADVWVYYDDDKVALKGKQTRPSGWLDRLRYLWHRAGSFLAGG